MALAANRFAADIAKDAEAPAEELTALESFAWMAALTKQRDASYDVLHRSNDLLAAARGPWSDVRRSTVLASVKQDLREDDHGLEFSANAVHLSEKNGASFFQAYSSWVHAKSLLAENDADEALRFINDAIARYEDLEITKRLGPLLITKGSAMLAKNDHDGKAILREGIERSKMLNHWWSQIEAYDALIDQSLKENNEIVAKSYATLRQEISPAFDPASVRHAMRTCLPHFHRLYTW